MSSKFRAKKKKSPETMWSMIMPPLPYDIILDIVARIPRFYYPTISLVSKSFRSLIASPELYTRRSFLGCAEHCLYAILYNRDTNVYRFYVLGWNVKSNGLAIIRSLPPMPSRGWYIAVGSKILHVLDGFSARSSFSIDCKSHTVQPISDIPKYDMVNNKVAGIIDGKTYVIGRCLCDDEVSSRREWCTRVLVFDTKTRTWEPKMIKPYMELGVRLVEDVVAMEDKIYMRDSKNSFVYAPKENKWETDEMLNSKRWEGACVVDNVLYYYDFSIHRKNLIAYDPKQRCWRLVNGLEELLSEIAHYWRPKTVSYGGKLAMFFPKDQYAEEEICYAEIALERRQGGEIWGKVQCCDVVIDDGNYCMDECLAVTF